ncbi:hypothetical protein OIU85_011424 [Salix viminalis]|uniref:Uncharacterized protein n=1 Tax=Salix viminalis TaxID=40686 RepID=A0A9Q0SEX9_SALVM|nr:hypothetical protein OIU85_011424 [Salix viminalis]
MKVVKEYWRKFDEQLQVPRSMGLEFPPSSSFGIDKNYPLKEYMISFQGFVYKFGGTCRISLREHGALHDGLTEEIKNINSCFCRLCSENGRYYNIVETPFQEKEGLVAIKDSLKEVANVLMILQRLRSCQPIDRQEALTRLEEGRLILMEKVSQYRGRPLGVVEELNACFSNGKTVFDWNLSQKRKIKGDDFNVQEEKRTKTAGFVVCWIRMLFNRWRWQKAIGVAAKLILVSASVSSTVKFCHGEPLHCCGSQRKALSMVEPVDSRTKENSTALSLSNRSLDVFYGRG